ncbi:MAG: GIY-YIG nuclease family protein [Deltaproteobacteria bacterium]|nr:GIY-YIG nuclease family protein [Deltaproteobacteria bacterium]
MNIKPSGWYVYMLRCNDDSLYAGITIDLVRRLKEHNYGAKGARYTRARRPVQLVYQEAAASRSDAAKREYQLKKMSPGQKRLLVQRYDNDRMRK